MANTIKAHFYGEGVRNAKNYGDSKEVVGQYKVIALEFVNGAVAIPPVFRELVDARLYMGRSKSASTVYASIWVHSRDFYTTGKGQAGGYGYCKRSAALDAAIRDADIGLFGNAYTGKGEPDFTQPTSISGVGETAIESALYAIAEALGYDRANLYLVRC
ncbi:MAG: hypothetical protein ACK5S6_03455 [bacterium]|jgi:hypothetical protein